MAWQLTVYTIDVSQGESALIIAEDPAAGLHRTMLIDGGRQGWAKIVHNFVQSKLAAHGGYPLDHISLSHFDDDHSNGVIGLLNADNMRRICELVANAVVEAATANLAYTRPQQIACGALAAMATVQGAYGVYAGQIAIMCASLAPAVLGMNDANAARAGYVYAENNINAPIFASIPVGGTGRKRDIAFDSGVAAGAALQNGVAVLPPVFAAAFNLISATLPPDLRFDTGGLYRNVHLIDIGDNGYEPQEYADAVLGEYITQQGYSITAPNINRARTEPNLQDEVLWNTGAGAGPAPANSPAMFCLAVNGTVWQGIGVPSVPVIGTQPSNNVSIGLIIRFGNFYFYTGGDLPSGGEDPLATAVMGQPLPNPQGGLNFPAPARIAALKCGHHGAASSTSQAFLNTTLARAAMISCGDNGFNNERHPSQATVDRLDGRGMNAPPFFFYLTNCNYLTNHVPASNGQNQLAFPGNVSRVAGQNHVANLNAARHRGNIELALSQAESIGFKVAQQFHVTYYDDDVVFGLLPGMRTEITPF